jgi:hypothetical protein
MRTTVAGFIIAAALVLAGAAVEACGDKFLVIGRGVRRVQKARHPASVLLYLRPGSSLPQAAKEMNLQATLRQAGHRVDVVEETALLRRKLEGGGYDFVLADLPDAAVVAHDAGAGAGAPYVVPVVYKGRTDAMGSSQQTYPLVIQAGRSLSYLAKVDAAMERRARTAAPR